jgi:hypothetical protein
MTDQIEIQHIQLNTATLAQVFKLPQQMIDYLWERIDIAKKEQKCHKKYIGYIPKISHSYKLEDPQNLLVPNLYDILFNPDSNPKMFEFINLEIETIYNRFPNQSDNVVKPYLNDMWVNFQKKGEFIPLHSHGGVFSFVIWMDIPYHPKDESILPFVNCESSRSTCGNFTFTHSSDKSREVIQHVIPMSPEFNGYCCFFPSDLCHQVYPFYTSDKDRISISGNIMYR